MGKNSAKKILQDIEVLAPEETSVTQSSSEDKKQLRLVDSEKQVTENEDTDLLKHFELKSEYVEKNVNLPKPTAEEMSRPVQENVVVYTSSDVRKVDPKELKEIIKTTKDIKKVVVEKISVDEAKRISMLYEPKKGLDSNLADDFLPGLEEQKNVSVSRGHGKTLNFNIKSLEKNMNNSFLNEGAVGDSVRGNVRASNPNKPKNNQRPKMAGSNNPLQNSPNQEVAETGNGLTLKDREHEMKRVAYTKHTLSRKKGKIHNGYYYRAKDHVELFKTGSSYLKDFKKGMKSFGFITSKLKEIKEKTVFGVCSFFNYHEQVSILIITTELENSFYDSFVTELQTSERTVFDEDFTYTVHVAKGFEILEAAQLRKTMRNLREYDYEDFVRYLVDSYDLVLWDLPELDIMESNREMYFPVIQELDNISFVVAENQTRFKNIEKMISFFNKYQVKLKGFLFSRTSSSNSKREAA